MRRFSLFLVGDCNEKSALTLSLLSMLLWTACDDVTGSSNNKESSEAEQISIEVETFDDLPNCTVNREGVLAKTTDDGSIYKCSDKQWKTYKSGSSNGTVYLTNGYVKLSCNP